MVHMVVVVEVVVVEVVVEVVEEVGVEEEEVVEGVEVVVEEVVGVVHMVVYMVVEVVEPSASTGKGWHSNLRDSQVHTYHGTYLHTFVGSSGLLVVGRVEQL